MAKIKLVSADALQYDPTSPECDPQTPATHLIGNDGFYKIRMPLLLNAYIDSLIKFLFVYTSFFATLTIVVTVLAVVTKIDGNCHETTDTMTVAVMTFTALLLCRIMVSFCSTADSRSKATTVVMVMLNIALLLNLFAVTVLDYLQIALLIESCTGLSLMSGYGYHYHNFLTLYDPVCGITFIAVFVWTSVFWIIFFPVAVIVLVKNRMCCPCCCCRKLYRLFNAQLIKLLDLRKEDAEIEVL